MRTSQVQDAVASWNAVSARNERNIAMFRLSLAAAASIAVTLATVPATRAAGDYGYVALALIAGLLALAATRIAESAPSGQAMWLIIGAAVALSLALLMNEPLLSTDITCFV